MCGYWQPLVAVELFNMDQIDEIEHRACMERQGDNTNISFSPVAPMIPSGSNQKQVKSTTSDSTPPTSNEKPSFGP